MESLVCEQLKFVFLEKYENEFKTMCFLYAQPVTVHLQKMSLIWLQSQADSKRLKINSAEQSAIWRKKGNEVFQRTNRNLLLACDLYTKAIFEAPSGSEELPLGYANRAISLQEFGYFLQAYDDCTCALEHGYPKRLRFKIIMRQAYCAWKMGDIERMQMHVESLEALKLNASSIKQETEKLRIKLNQMLKKHQNPDTKNDTLKNEIQSARKTHKIVHSPEPIGRCMVATTSLQANELIFRERAASFVSIFKYSICQQCAITNFIPIPCAHCHGQVVFCSRKCQNMHETIHIYTCAAHRWQLMPKIGIGQLALYTVLNGLPEILSLLKSESDAEKIWQFIHDDDESLLWNRNLAYSQTLRMSTHLNQMPEEIARCALMADLLVIYLREYTSFFDFVKESAANQNVWELITAALILRHIGQLIINGHTIHSIVPWGDRCNFPLLDYKLWIGPNRLQRGFLHRYAGYGEVAAANFPNLSMCNHSCAPSFRQCFSGRYVNVNALKVICEGEEIFNCYTPDYRKWSRNQRRELLTDVYGFNCECYKCQRTQPDQDYEQYHQYYCENPKCRQVFVPHITEQKTLQWWSQVANTEQLICCHICDTAQSFHWYDDFDNLLQSVETIASRRLLFKGFEHLKNFLVGNHELKVELGLRLVRKCYEIHCAGDHLLEDGEFSRLVEILKFILIAKAEQIGAKSIDYVATMTYLWDIIALGKYKILQQEMKISLDALEIISHDIEIIFRNYFKEFIEPLLTKQIE